MAIEEHRLGGKRLLCQSSSTHKEIQHRAAVWELLVSNHTEGEKHSSLQSLLFGKPSTTALQPSFILPMLEEVKNCSSNLAISEEESD